MPFQKQNNTNRQLVVPTPEDKLCDQLLDRNPQGENLKCERFKFRTDDQTGVETAEQLEALHANRLLAEAAFVMPGF